MKHSYCAFWQIRYEFQRIAHLDLDEGLSQKLKVVGPVLLQMGKNQPQQVRIK